MKIDKILKNDLLKSGMIFLIGSLTRNVFNYLYHLFTGRLLGPEQYGVLGSLFAIIYVVTFTSGTFNKVISKFSAEFKGKKQHDFIKYLVKRALTKLLMYGAIILMVYFLVSPLIARFLKITVQ